MTQVGIPSIFMDGGDTYIGRYIRKYRQTKRDQLWENSNLYSELAIVLKILGIPSFSWSSETTTVLLSSHLSGYPNSWNLYLLQNYLVMSWTSSSNCRISFSLFNKGTGRYYLKK